MTTAPKLACFAVALAALFGVGAAVGSAIGPIDVGGGHGGGVMTTASVADSGSTAVTQAMPPAHVSVP